MTSTSANYWTTELLGVLSETFEQVHGIYLDRGTSLLETLADVTAAEASRRVSARNAPIAAHVEHVIFYLDVIAQFARGENPGKVDWNAIWQNRTGVTAAEWDAMRTELRAAYERTRTLIAGTANSSGEDEAGGALAMVVHTAHHLGEIRCLLGVIRPDGPEQH